MDVGRPIAAVVPTLDGPALEVLARTTRPLTGREVHRLAGVGSESGIRLVLNRLAEQGLVDADQAGQATLYTANRDHLAWPAVERLTQLRQELLQRLGDLAASWPVKPMAVAVFGSAVRGDGDVASDIDVLVIRSDSEQEVWEAQIDGLRDSVAAWTGNPCQVYDLTESEYHQHAQSGEPLAKEWRRDAVIVFGTPLAKIDTTGAA